MEDEEQGGGDEILREYREKDKEFRKREEEATREGNMKEVRGIREKRESLKKLERVEMIYVSSSFQLVVYFFTALATVTDISLRPCSIFHSEVSSPQRFQQPSSSSSNSSSIPFLNLPRHQLLRILPTLEHQSLLQQPTRPTSSSVGPRFLRSLVLVSPPALTFVRVRFSSHHQQPRTFLL